MKRVIAYYLFSIGFALLGVLAAIEDYTFMSRFRTNFLDEVAQHFFIWLPILLALGVGFLLRTGRTATFSICVLATWGFFRFSGPFLIVHCAISVICVGYLLLKILGAYQNARSRLRRLVLPIVAVLVMVVPAIVANLFVFTDNEVLQMFIGARIFFVYAIIFIASFSYDWYSETPPGENTYVEVRD